MSLNNPSIPRHALQSANISDCGYCPSTQRLHLGFSNGSVYEYAGVPADEHEKLTTHPNPGSYFHSHIKPKFKSRKLDQDNPQD